MTVLLGIVLGLLYVVQPVDVVRAPVEWMNETFIQYAQMGVGWLLGWLGDSDGAQFLRLMLIVGAPGVAGLLLNLVAPLSRLVRVGFSFFIVLVSLGGFGVLEWWQASLFSLGTLVVGSVLSLLSGAVMESVAAFFSVTLGAVQIRSVLEREPSEAMVSFIEVTSRMLGLGVGESYWVCLGLAFAPLMMVAGWFIFRLTPGR